MKGCQEFGMMVQIHANGHCDDEGHGSWEFNVWFPCDFGSGVELINSGTSNGTTKNQMALMAILQSLKALKSECGYMMNRLEFVVLKTNNEWAVNCLSKVYNCKERVVKQYLDEIEWASGGLKITYKYEVEKDDTII